MSQIRSLTFEQIHGKKDVGSTRIRIHNLIKYWDEFELYKYGENPDVMIYQKVYTTFDYKFHEHFEGMQILDICDPDFKDSSDIFIKETMDNMDAVVVPTKAFQKFLQQMTKTPVRVIKDRFDLSEFPTKKVHRGRAKNVVWFGYAHNAWPLKMAVMSLEQRGLGLTIISNEDPHAYKWAQKPAEYEKMYKWIKYEHPKAYTDIQQGDICVFPPTTRPTDVFKSENKTVIAELLGVPVARDAEELDRLLDAEERNRHIDTIYDKLKQEYDCRVSVKEYKELISEIRKSRKNESL